MTSLTWQTLALLAVTYFAGCCIGCLARRAAWRRRAQPAAPVRPLAMPAVANPGVIISDRSPVPAINGSAAVVSTQAPREAFRRADVSAPQPAAEVPAAVSDAEAPVTRFERALTAGGQASMPPPSGLDSAGDDLTRIRAIDAALQARLEDLGVGTFAAIARWTAADTAHVSRELGFKGRIEQENWIEQAQILSAGGDTRYSQRLARGEAAAARTIEDEGEPPPAVSRAQRPADDGTEARSVASGSAPVDQPIASTSREIAIGSPASSPNVSDRAAFAHRRPQEAEMPPLPPARPAAGGARDDLQRVGGIDIEIEALLNGHGVTRYAQIASWTRIDIERLDGGLAQDGRVARENWIEQAQILARGGDTAFSRAYDRRAAEMQDSQQEGGEQTDHARAGRTNDLAALRSVRSEAYRPAQDVRGGRSEPDDLKRIRGIGLLIEKKLNSVGVIEYEQIANWTAADIDRISRTLDFIGRIERENWVEQARILASGGQTEFSRRIDRATAAT